MAEKSNENSFNTLGVCGAFWGVIGFFALIVSAIVRLFQVSVELLDYEMTLIYTAVLIINCLFMAYSEGYKGFQKNYAPRFAARVKYLSCNATTIEVVLAPLFCMTFFNAPRKRIITSFVLFIMIIGLVILFRFLPQPWRGILDAGVVIGLMWGLLATLYYCVVAFLDPSFDVDPELGPDKAVS